MNSRSKPIDQSARDAAVSERRRNIVIDAGAGTGKTTLIVARLVEMVAPRDDAVAALPILRLAAVTFTRRAAGELRLRIRQAFLQALSESSTSAMRKGRLSAALSDLDSAYVSTLHGFADRLLRMRPRQARISPAYQIAEDPQELLDETFVRIMHAAERGTLADEVQDTSAAIHAQEAQAALRDALSIGLLRVTVEYDFFSKFGLDALIADFIDTRDIEVPMPALRPLDVARIHDAIRRFTDAMHGADPNSRAGARLTVLAKALSQLLAEPDPVVLYAEILELLNRHTSKQLGWRKKDDFAGDAIGFNAWKLLQGDAAEGETNIRQQLMQTLGAWLGPRLLRVRPVAIAMHELVKRRHQVVDHLDLVIKLRDLLRDDLDSRGFYQSLFDHVFVDEFQDTDPLQAEIVAYLIERSARASHWQSVELQRGKLTIVGDPKQSIYRFRRADIETYDAARRLIASGPDACLEVELEANFRSRAPLVQWFNHRFDAILQPGTGGRRFEPSTGAVYNHHLAPGRSGEFPPSVHIVPFATTDAKAPVDEQRRLEAEAIAHYIKWLVHDSDTQIDDPITSIRRPLGFGDIAMLCLSTTQLNLLFPQLDALRIPHTARGGTLFLQDRVHRQFLLALRALADRDDGIAEAALLRPPFFALDLRDLALERGARRRGDDTGIDPAALHRVRCAREHLQNLRRQRFSRSPGTTARDLLETTGLGVTAASGPNGLQRLERLHELCLVLGQRAADEHLDFDAVTALTREWIDRPIQLDPPHAVGAKAVQIMTAHQAKGLEFPVVVFWDGCAQWNDIERTIPFRPQRDGAAWTMNLDKLSCELPEGAGIKEREQRYRESERRRLVYVLATRARDILILPRPASANPRHIAETLRADAPPATELELPRYAGPSGPAWWQHGPERPPSLIPPPVAPDLELRWQHALRKCASPRLLPIAVSEHARAGSGGADVPSSQLVGSSQPGNEVDDSAPPVVARREGRFGSTFGTTVHRALELVLTGRQSSIPGALAVAIAQTGLDHHHDEARADIERTLAMLDAEQLLPSHGRTIALEYPIAGAVDGSHLLSGIIDFISCDGTTLDIIDFKTDQPPTRDVMHTHANYVAQTHLYAALLSRTQLPIGRRGLLFTAEGPIRWLP